MNRQLQADFWLLLVALAWGSTFTLVKEVLTEIKPYNLLALRFAFAFLTMLIIFRKRLATVTRQELAAGAFIGVFLFAGYAFQTVGMQYTTAGKAGFITGLSVVIVPLAAAIILRQKPGARSLLGVVLATIGLALLALNEDWTIARGDLIVLGCAFSYALHIISVGRFAPRMDAITLTIVQIGLVAVISGSISLGFEHSSLDFPTGAWLTVVFLGMLITPFTFGVQNVAQKFTTPTHTALIFAAEPVFAALFAYLMAGELLSGRQLLGCGLILAGIVASELRKGER
jgi:drug/metabolite transporter (DMT)-like permease